MKISILFFLITAIFRCCSEKAEFYAERNGLLHMQMLSNYGKDGHAQMNQIFYFPLF